MIGDRHFVAHKLVTVAPEAVSAGGAQSVKTGSDYYIAGPMAGRPDWGRLDDFGLVEFEVAIACKGLVYN